MIRLGLGGTESESDDAEDENPEFHTTLQEEGEDPRICMKLCKIPHVLV